MTRDDRREPESEDPHEVPTARQSCTFQRWETFSKEARALVTRLEAEARVRERVLERIDIRGARRCTELAQAALELAVAFEAWPTRDPGQIQRHDQVAKLLDLRVQAQELASAPK